MIIYHLSPAIIPTPGVQLGTSSLQQRRNSKLKLKVYISVKSCLVFKPVGGIWKQCINKWPRQNITKHLANTAVNHTLAPGIKNKKKRHVRSDCIKVSGVSTSAEKVQQ